jgi:hypothetical protein
VILGSGVAYFEECTLASNGPGSVTAQYGVSAYTDYECILSFYISIYYSRFKKQPLIKVVVFNYASLYATTPSSLIASSASLVSYTTSTVTGTNYLGRPADDYSR